MTNETALHVESDRIDAQDDSAVREWSSKLSVTPDQIREAISAVGDKGADVEMHLKGSHATSNSERVHGANGGVAPKLAKDDPSTAPESGDKLGT